MSIEHHLTDDVFLGLHVYKYHRRENDSQLSYSRQTTDTTRTAAS